MDKKLNDMESGGSYTWAIQDGKTYERCHYNMGQRKNTALLDDGRIIPYDVCSLLETKETSEFQFNEPEFEFIGNGIIDSVHGIKQRNETRRFAFYIDKRKRENEYYEKNEDDTFAVYMNLNRCHNSLSTLPEKGTEEWDEMVVKMRDAIKNFDFKKLREKEV